MRLFATAILCATAIVPASAQQGSEIKSRNAAGHVITFSQIVTGPDLRSSEGWVNLAKGNTQYLNGMATFDKLGNADAVTNYSCKFRLAVRVDKHGLDAGWIVSFRPADRAKQSCRGIPAAVSGVYFPV